MTTSQGQDRTAWAAYVLGHHVGFLRSWLTSKWDHRHAAAAGRVVVPELPVEFHELIEALKQVGRIGLLRDGRAVNLVAAAYELRSVGVDMLDQLRLSTPEEGDFDWELDSTPGMTEWASLYRLMEGAFESNSPWERWRKAGELLADLRPDWVFTDSTRVQMSNLVADASLLREYPFLADVRRALANSGPAVDAPLAQMLDPITGVPDVARVEGYVRDGLWNGAPPEPWFQLNAQKVSVLGTHLKAGDFSQAQFGILWLLCERPRREVSRRTIKVSCGLECDLEHIKSHVTRLRDRLRPAVMGKYLPGELPTLANECFIVGARDRLGPYQLEVDPPRVAVVPPRPHFMKTAT